MGNLKVGRPYAAWCGKTATFRCSDDGGCKPPRRRVLSNVHVRRSSRRDAPSTSRFLAETTVRRAALATIVAGILTLCAGVSVGSITITLDYTYDTYNEVGFFDTQAKRDRLQAAADALSYRLLDDLQAIAPSGGNTWTAKFVNPLTGAEEDLGNLSIPANDLRIYVGGRDLGTTTLGQGGPGAIGANGSQAWLTTVSTRGEGATINPGAVNFGPWGGSLTFTTNPAVNWNFSAAPPVMGQFDFYSVATHELTHLLGFGTCDSWDNHVSGSFFTGPASVAEYDGVGNVPLSADHAHWVNGTNDDGHETAMDPSLGSGTRKPLTALDLAALTDIGWVIGPPVPLVGDVNGDGFVDIFDVNDVSAHWGQSGPAGDANGDSMVDIFDINLISSNWGTSYGGGAEVAVAAVPEPGAIGLGLAGSLGAWILVHRWRRQAQSLGRRFDPPSTRDDAAAFAHDPRYDGSRRSLLTRHHQSARPARQVLAYTGLTGLYCVHVPIHWSALLAPGADSWANPLRRPRPPCTVL